MADAVTNQILEDGPRNTIVKLTSISDGTGEAAVTKVTLANLSTVQGMSPTSVAIRAIESDIQGMQVVLLWKASTNVTIHTLAAGKYRAKFGRFFGLFNNAGTGKTGDILLTSQNIAGTATPPAGSTYSIVLELVKKYN